MIDIYPNPDTDAVTAAKSIQAMFNNNAMFLESQLGMIWSLVTGQTYNPYVQNYIYTTSDQGHSDDLVNPWPVPSGAAINTTNDPYGRDLSSGAKATMTTRINDTLNAFNVDGTNNAQALIDAYNSARDYLLTLNPNSDFWRTVPIMNQDPLQNYAPVYEDQNTLIGYPNDGTPVTYPRIGLFTITSEGVCTYVAPPARSVLPRP